MMSHDLSDGQVCSTHATPEGEQETGTPSLGRLADRYTDIQTYRHTDIQTYRHTDIQTYRHTDIQTYRHTDIQTYRQTDKPTDIPTDTQTDRHTDRRTSRRPTAKIRPSAHLSCWLFTTFGSQQRSVFKEGSLRGCL